MNKIVCGIELKGSEAIIVILRGSRINHEIVGSSVTRICIGDDKDQSQVQSFAQTFFRHLSSENVSLVGIKARAVKGEYSGGPVSFKIEGIIQNLQIPVNLIHPSTAKATIRKNPVDVDSVGVFRYQQEAYKIAYHLLDN